MEIAAETTTKNIRKSRFKPVVTVAENEDGVKIGELVKSNGFEIEVEWNDIYPYWLIAKWENEIIGCIQVLPGKPIGRMEMLAVDIDIPKVKRAQVVWRLLVSSVTLLRASGTQYASGMVLFNDKQYKKILKKRGAWTIGQGNIMIGKIL